MTKEELKNSVLKDISSLNEEYFDKLEVLMKTTLEMNQKFNLTAIKNEESFRELMIFDSLIPLKYFNFENKKVLDVGTGAGFPGLPLAICSKGEFVLLDSTKKKIDHINIFVKDNDIKNARGVYSRAEDFSLENREQFDIVIARAVAPLNILLELCFPLLKVGGTFIAMKSSGVNQEIDDSNKALKLLNGEVKNIYTDYLPTNKEERELVEIYKTKSTNKKYPRKYSEIKKNPL